MNWPTHFAALESLIGSHQQGPPRSLSEALGAAGEIQQEDIPVLASYFDDVEFYLDIMKLTDLEKCDVRKAVERHGSQVGIIWCLNYWKKHNPSSANFKSLLDILNQLSKETIYGNVCKYITTRQSYAVPV